MQETRWDNSEILTDSVSPAEFKKAMMGMTAPPIAEPAKQNKSVALHAPGTVVTLVNGDRYRVGRLGNWIRLDKKRSKKERRRR